jgi:hypothetical protein
MASKTARTSKLRRQKFTSVTRTSVGAISAVHLIDENRELIAIDLGNSR